MNNPTVALECGNCPGCPFVKGAIEQYEMLDDLANMALNRAFDEITPEAAEAIYDRLPEGGRLMRVTEEGVKPVESAEDMFTAMREGSDRFIDQLDMARGHIQERVADVTGHCGGALKMRASKAGQVVTATVCMSRAELENGETKVEPVVIDRREA